MTQDPHQQVREWIAGAGRSPLAGERQARLQDHLQNCQSCRSYAEQVGKIITVLRSVPLAADSELVRATQQRVRMRALQLQQSRERAWLVAMACLLVGLSGAITTSILWRGFEWMAQSMQLSGPVWQVGFLMVWIAPTLVVSMLFLLRGSHSSRHHGATRDQRRWKVQGELEC